jgi:hypothetical protein
VKRTPLRPGQPPKRKTPLKPSRKPIRARKTDPAKRAWAKHRCKPYTDWLKTQPCCITGKYTGEYVSRPKGIAWTSDDEFVWTSYRTRVIVDPAHVI